MRKLSIFSLFSVLCTMYYVLLPTEATAQIPQIHLACDKVDDPEFHSLRPYQAAPCGDAPKARFCSNDLIFIESFDLAYAGEDCKPQHTDSMEDGIWDFTCSPGGDDYPSGGRIPKHELIVTLDDSFFPIMGNTEDPMEDSTKVNNYMSWYLSGVNYKRETGIPTNEQVVNYSGPVNKLTPSIFQDAQRIQTIESISKTVIYKPEGEDKETEEPENHDQIAVCAERQISLAPKWFTEMFDTGAIGLGEITPVDCSTGASKYRLSKWKEEPLFDIKPLIPYLSKMIPNDTVQYLVDQIADRWPKNTPPLPWADKDGKPFESDEKYKKAYNEWKGDICAFIPIPIINKDFLLCVGIPGVTNNEYADLYPFVPLSNNTDKKGAEYILGDGPSYTPDSKTEIGAATHSGFRVAPLYMAHTKEVDELTTLLKSLYTPTECIEEDGKQICTTLKNEPVPETTEYNNCSAATIRFNKGDNLFPGDPDELQVNDVTYPITKATCHEEVKITTKYTCKSIDLNGDGIKDYEECKDRISRSHTFKCPAEVTIKIGTGTKTPYADKIYSKTVADSGSIFRKIFPKVEEGSPVSCIADIPTVTGVEYTPEDQLQKGNWKFKVKDYPEDSGGTTETDHQLTFPHIGSMYEYFLNGIQTALRPKGYGGPIVSGKCLDCGKLPDLPEGAGSCILGQISSRIGEIPENLKKIVSAAAETYKVPPNLILGVMFGEGNFNGASNDPTLSIQEQAATYQWSDNNVANWATCSKLPNCSDPYTSLVHFSDATWAEMAAAIEPDLKALDPNRKPPDACNLLDVIYGLGWYLHKASFGTPMFSGHSCFGIPLNSGSAVKNSGCDWDDKDIETAIRWWEFGTDYNSTYMCATLENSCLLGGGGAANCPTGDDCETVNFRYSQPSHNACVYDVAHGN